MDVHTNLKTFLMVARCGSFSEAARRLYIVPSVAAKRVAQLEKTVGALLFKRSTRKCSLTAAGRRMHPKAAEAIASFDEAVRALQRDEGYLQGHIRVMAPTTLTLFYLGGVFSEFVHAHPQITLEITLVDQSVNPLEEGIDIAISGRSASYEGVVDVPLCSAQPLLCAAPTYLDRRGTPTHPRELMGHDCLVFKPIGLHWVFRNERGDVDVDVSPRLIADDNFTLLQAAKASCGIAILPKYVAAEALAKGELHVVLPGYPTQENWFKAYVPRRRLELAPVKTLLEWLTMKMVDFPTPIKGVKNAPVSLSKKKTAT